MGAVKSRFARGFRRCTACCSCRRQPSEASTPPPLPLRQVEQKCPKQSEDTPQVTSVNHDRAQSTPCLRLTDTREGPVPDHERPTGEDRDELKQSEDASEKLDECEEKYVSERSVENSTKLLRERLTALEEYLVSAAKLRGAIQEVLASARMLLQNIQKAGQDESTSEESQTFAVDELTIALHQSLKKLETVLDNVEARPATVSAVIGAVKELVAAIKSGQLTKRTLQD